MFPHVAAEYYTKRAQHMNEVEERRLRDLITNAIPSGTEGWRDDFALPHIIVRQPVTQDKPSTLELQPALRQHGELTPPPSPTNKPATPSTTPPEASIANPWETPLYIDALPRQPPHPCNPSPSPPSMSTAARLACLAHWTCFSATGIPYLLTAPHAKDFDLQWRLAIESGSSDEALVRWAERVWWCVWARQCVVNWRGMWAKRLEKEDRKAERLRMEAEEQRERERVEHEAGMRAEELVRKHREKVMSRLEGLNRALGLIGVEK